MEDLATVAESIALADRLFSRHRGTLWSRVINLEIPVFELQTFQSTQVGAALIDAIHFLTGDEWLLTFVKRTGLPENGATLPFERVKYEYVMPFSDGLDSFAQGRLLEREVGREAILRLRSAKIGKGNRETEKLVLRVPRHLGAMHKPEKTYRSRPFVFFTFAGIGAFVADARAVVIGESGQGSLGPAMIRYADEWPFRSTHPGFVSRISSYLSLALGRPISFRLPQLWRTKGEVLRELADQNLLHGWNETTSCSVRPNNRHGAETCGICGGCMLRSLALFTSQIAQVESCSAFRITAPAEQSIDGKDMTSSERHMAVRSLGTMAEFARLLSYPRGKNLIESESRLFNESEYTDVEANLSSLANRHAIEWQYFVKQLPKHGWARTIVDLL